MPTPYEPADDDDCPDFPDQPEHCNVITVMRVVLAAISLCGCFFIMGSIAISGRYRNFAQRQVFFLSLAAALDTAPYFFGQQREGFFCTAQALMMTWFDWAVLLWVCCITHSLYVHVVQLRPSVQQERLYHAVSWGLPLMIAAVPLLAGEYGYGGLWCWIVSNWLRFGLWYGPLVVLVLGLFAINGHIFRKVNSRAKRWQGTYNPGIEAEKVFLREQVQPLKLYPLVYLLTSVAPLVNRIQNAMHPNEPIFELYLIHSMCSPMVGFLNAIVYASNTDAGFWRQCSLANIERALTARRSSVHEYRIDSGTLIPLDDDLEGSVESDDSEAGPTGALEKSPRPSGDPVWYAGAYARAGAELDDGEPG